MEITFKTKDDIEVIQNVIDCIMDDGEYKITKVEKGSLQSPESVETKKINGVIIGAVRKRREIHVEALAAQIETGTKIQIPVKPLAEDCDIDDESWEYNPSFDFGEEIVPYESNCFLRNICVIAHNSVLKSNNESEVFHLNAGEKGISTNETKVSVNGPYKSYFGSGWTSTLITGSISRLTSYKESTKLNWLSPSDSTKGRVEWAF